MIITESDRNSKSSSTADSTSIAPPSAHVVGPSPPAYHSVPGPSTPSETPMPFLNPPMEVKAREPAWRRFAKALCLAVVVYSVLVMLVKTVIHLAENHLVQSGPDGPYDLDGRVVRCANNTFSSGQLKQRQQPLAIDTSNFPPDFPPIVPPYTSTTSFSVPVSSDLIFLLTRGSLDYSSSVNFELSEDTGDDVEIDVTMSYFSKAARKRAQVCLLERDEGEKGIGIFTPRWHFPNFPKQTDRIKFLITVRFPKSDSEKPLAINGFETNMGIWNHRITSLESRVVFKYLSIQGSSATIHVESVSAEAAKFKTSNAPISGTFNVSHHLVLATSNAPINAAINLENHANQDPTQVHVRTTNARINTPITLDSNQSYFWKNPPAFSVDVGTTNGQLNVNFPSAPSSPFSILELKGKTTNAETNVKLHPTYEGSISLQTSRVFSCALLQRQGVEDPSGQGRQRTVTMRKVTKSVLEAGVWWGDDPNQDEGKGKVKVSTTNSNNIIQLV